MYYTLVLNVDKSSKIVVQLDGNTIWMEISMRKFDYMKLQKMQWDSQILNYIAQIHEFKGKQETFLSKKPVELKRLVEIAKIQSTEASNKIEGIVTSSTRIKQLCEQKTTPRNRDETEISGYRDVLNTIHESYDGILIKPSYILQLHQMLYSYSEKSIGGKFKNTQNYIKEIHDDGSEFIRFTPLAPYETPQAMEDICEQFNLALDNNAVDALILIPLFVRDFLCIHPFNDGNGRMSRLLTILLLYKCGYRVGKYISIESKIEKTKDAYYSALANSSDGWHEDDNDGKAFIKYTLGIILSAYRDLESRIELLGEKKKFPETVKKAIDSTIGKFTKQDIMDKCPNISDKTIINVLTNLVKDGYLERRGAGRATYYMRKS